MDRIQLYISIFIEATTLKATQILKVYQGDLVAYISMIKDRLILRQRNAYFQRFKIMCLGCIREIHKKLNISHLTHFFVTKICENEVLNIY